MIYGGKKIHLKPCDGLRLLALHGSGTVGGKERIARFFETHTNIKERAGFVKDECMNYGFGSPTVRPCYLDSGDFFRGVKYPYYDEFGVHHEKTATWKELAEKIAELLEQGEYLPVTGGGLMNEVQKNN